MMIRRFWLVLTIAALWSSGLAAKSPLSPDEKAWLRKVDVLITPEERRIFKKRLQTRHERKSFIELFWAKRDPDLEDNRNPFKEEYMARYDYVMANYEVPSATVPLNDRSILYLMLGKPTRMEYRVDVSIVGPRFRNTFFHHRPELWVYENLGFDYKRKRLKIQFIPTTSFGDYVALTDNFTSIWLKKLKYKLIYHPDLEFAPLQSVSGENFQDVTAVNSEEDEEDPEWLDDPELEGSTVFPEAEGEERPMVEGTTLSVPTPTESADSLAIEFDPASGNAMGLTGSSAYFSSGEDRSLMLARIGFPLKSLDFEFKNRQFEAPFILSYSLINAGGQTLFADSLENQVKVPDRKYIDRENQYFSEELALLVPGDRYRLKVQLKDVGSGRTAFYETSIEIPNGDRERTRTTDLVLMDPNVNPEGAKFKVREKPLTLRLSNRYRPGDRIYPVVEVIHPPEGKALDRIRLHAIQGNEKWQTWELYPEELTDTNYGTVLVHPVLSTKSLPVGDYRLRFELDLGSGDLLLSETEFKLSLGAD